MSRGASSAPHGPLSIRAFARLTGVSHKAVQKGIASGRLKRSLTSDGKIKDGALAAREWAAGAAQPSNGGGNGAARHSAGTLVEAQLRLAGERAAALELANRRRRGEVHDVDACSREQFGIARMVRERVLNVVDRMGELAPDARARLRAELVQALIGLADALGHDEHA